MELRLSYANLIKIVSFSLWGWLYLWIAENAKDKSPEWLSRVITLLHGSVVTLAGIGECNALGLAKYNFLISSILIHKFLMLWSWGYFSFDLFWCLIYWRHQTLMLLHHVASLIALTLCIHKSDVTINCDCALALMEFTNPLLQIRWFLRAEGYSKTLIYQIIEITYLVTFVIIRGIIGTYATFVIVSSSDQDWPEKTLAIVFYLVSLKFLYQMFGYVFHTYRGRIVGKLAKHVRWFKRFDKCGCLKNNTLSSYDHTVNLKL